MNHPKMRYTYVGIDSHKGTHTAVFLDCFFDKLGEIVFNNRPSAFRKFLSGAEKLKIDGTELLFGLEDASAFGRRLLIYLKDNGQLVKHVNAFLVAQERKNQNITEKSDSVDAECAARVLLSKFDKLPDAEPYDKYWILRTLVVRRDFIIRSNISLKNHLHNLLTQHYPNYRSFFENIDCDTSLAFFSRYPSPSTLKDVTVEELTALLKEHSHKIVGEEKAREILDSLEDTEVKFQEIRDTTVQSTIRQIQFNLKEVKQLEDSLATFLARFDCPLTSMAGLDVVSAAQFLSCIGDIKRFESPAKLARYAGIAPITYASGQKDKKYSNQRPGFDTCTLRNGVNQVKYHSKKRELSLGACF